ncbi:hypothetical protein PCANC_08486 [Puccinia coronata f. sp. avenae]|uniref:Uncharacterized protein n=1 Tax=Puccinia coronata f. sp. avenae TaxID=200324 RepID=A0A2N5T482_9BASI|nr:hypothetical protein PCASD_13266 [Puccinia coronata f. sp. avenae]PLW20303.1 hypothetical protein PCANC_08486 [Puccinia coronata f. sp. avenae]
MRSTSGAERHGPGKMAGTTLPGIPDHPLRELPVCTVVTSKSSATSSAPPAAGPPNLGAPSLGINSSLPSQMFMAHFI